MAIQITTLTAGNILIQTGKGVPNHLAPKGSQFTDIDTAKLYFNKDGLNEWELNIDVANTGSTIGIYTFNAFSSTTVGQTSVVASSYNDLLTFSGANIDVLVDNANKIITLSAKTDNDTIFTGGTVTGATNFINGLSANTFSATTYFNLPTDIFVTGGTYSDGIATFINNTGGTFNVTGFKTDDIYVTGVTYNDNIFTFTNNTGGTFNILMNVMTGLTVNGVLSANTINSNIGNIIALDSDSIVTNTLTGTSAVIDTISATTYQNLPTDIRVTGGTYNNNSGIATFTNNTGGTFTLNGFYTGYTAPLDIYVTGGTYDAGTATFTNNTGGTFNISGFKTDDVFVTGGTYSDSTGIATFINNTGGTYNVNGFFKTSDDVFVTGMTFNNGTYDLSIIRNDGNSFSQNLAILATDMTITGGTYNPNTGVATFENNTGGTFDVSGFLTGQTDTFVTGLTFNNNTLTLSQTNDEVDINVLINSFTGLTVGTISATTYQNLPIDVFTTGGTYSNGDILFTNNTGGTFTVTGLYTGYTAPIDVYVTGSTYNDNTFTFINNTGGTFNVNFDILTGLTVNGVVTATTVNAVNGDITGLNSDSIVTNTLTGTSAVIDTISATTYQNLPLDIYVTGATYNNGTAIFTNNTGGTFNISGLYTGATDVFVTGGTYSNGDILFTNNTGGTFNVSGLYTGYTAPIDVYVTGATYNNNNTFTFTNNTGDTFNVNFEVVSGLTVNGILSATTISATTFYGDGSNLTGISGGGTFTGGTVTGPTNFTNGLTASTISATTYFNLPTDVFTTGGTYNNGTGVVTFTNNTGGTFNVSGLYTGQTDTFVTGFTYSDNVFTVKQNNNQADLSVLVNTMTGLTATTLYTDYIDFNTGATVTNQAARLSWDDGNGTLAIPLKGGNVNLQIGQENVVLCYNSEATQLVDGEIVYVYSSQGNRPSVKRAIATSDGYSVTTLGMVTETINSGAEGFITTFGMVNNLNTIGYSGGTAIWLSPTVAGAFTNVKPQAPYHSVLLGYVVRVHASVGSIFVHISNGWELEELHNVRLTGETAGDLLSYSAYNGSNVWVNTKTLNGSYTITGNTTIGGMMKASTISATTYQNLPTDVYVTGGTYSNGISTFTNNTGGTFSVTGFYTGQTEIYTTGVTVDNNVISFNRNDVMSAYTISFSGINIDLITDDITKKITFSASTGGAGGGEVNTASNLGGGTGLFAQKSGVDLQFKSLTSTGGTVTISSDSTTVNIESNGGGSSTGVSNDNKIFSWFMNIT